MLMKAKKILSLLIMAALVISIIPVQRALAADPEVKTGRKLTTTQTGDGSEWIEIATYGNCSLIIRKDTIGYMAYDTKTPNYRESKVKAAVDDWFNRRSNSKLTATLMNANARLYDFTVTTDAATFNKEGQLASTNKTHLSIPLSAAARSGDGVAFLLNFTEAALFCSTQYALGPLNQYTKSSNSAISNYNSLNAPGSAQPENHFWLRTPGNSGTNVCTVGQGGMSSVGDMKGTVNQYDLTSNIIKIRPALWVLSGIFDETFKVTYNPNGGTGNPVDVPVVKDANHTVVTQGYTKDGFTLNGYNTKADGTGTAYAIGQIFKVTGNITLYAQWTAIPVSNFKVTYNPNGGEGSTVVVTVTKDADHKVVHQGYTKSDFTFNGYNTKADGTGTPYSVDAIFKVTADITLYAQWTPIPASNFTITYNPNGGTGSIVSILAAKDTKHKVVSQGYAKIGFTFNGYNTKVDGTGTTYTVGQEFTVTADITLFAMWTEIAGPSGPSPRGAVTKLLKIPFGTTIPTTAFRFTAVKISEDGNPPSAGMPAITINPITYSSSKPISEYTYITSDEDIDFYYLESNELFGNINWPHAGIYEYEIKEINDNYTGENEHMKYSNAVYSIKVFVSNGDADGDGFLDITQIVCIMTADDAGTSVGPDKQVKVDPTPGGGDEYETSQMIFTNEYWKHIGGTDPKDSENWTLFINKKVAGAFGDQTLYFDFEMAIKAPALTNVPLTYKAYVVEPDPANPGKYKIVTSSNNFNGMIGTDGSITFNSGLGNKVQFKLKDGQYLVFIDTPVGTVYEVTENAAMYYNPGVTVKYNNSSAEKTIPTVNTELRIPSGLDKNQNGIILGLGTKKLYVGEQNPSSAIFTNNRNNLIPTGLDTNTFPYIILLALALTSLLAYITAKIKKQTLRGKKMSQKT